MKLEIRHLTPYLPYGLNIKDVKHGSVFEALHFITTPNQDFSLFKGNFDQLTNDKYLKPVLFPLSSLTKEITINGETFVPIYKIYEFEQWDTDELYEIINNGTIEGIYNDLNLIPYSHAEKLFEWKIDVFGLIDAGLAEPVTEDFNPYK